jgi:hypothetical protein
MTTSELRKDESDIVLAFSKRLQKQSFPSLAWMAGTSPAMTSSELPRVHAVQFIARFRNRCYTFPIRRMRSPWQASEREEKGMAHLSETFETQPETRVEFFYLDSP